jgi:hypothetical protein
MAEPPKLSNVFILDVQGRGKTKIKGLGHPDGGIIDTSWANALSRRKILQVPGDSLTCNCR